MRFPRVRSIRSRLVLLSALSVALTALAMSIVTVALGFGQATDGVISQLNSVTTLKEQEIASWTSGLQLNLDIVLSGETIDDDLNTVTNTAALEAEKAAAYNRLRQRFTWAARRMGLFEELFFMDTTGAVLVSTNAGHERQRQGLNAYFLKGLKGKYIEQPSYSLSLDKLTVVASSPVEKEGKVIGVLAGRADLAGLNAIMIERAGLGETGETYLVGSNYRLLTYLRRTGYSIPDTYIRTAGTSAAVGRAKDGADSYAGYAGNTVIGVYRWIPELHVALIAEQERTEALGPTKLILIITGGVAMVAILLALLTALGFTRRIVGPLKELGTTASRITQGELDLRAKVERSDEIGNLADSFNQMTGQLSGLVHTLERRTDHLRAINESGRQISSSLELDQLLPEVASTLARTFSYESVRILLLTGDGTGRLHSCNLERECEPPRAVDLSQAETWPLLTSVAQSGARSLIHANESAESPSDAELEAFVDIAVPMRVGEKLVGVLEITSGDGQALDQQDLFAVETLADQLAVAIENARLYENASELAASKERQRLARDLHDAVSQTLFSVSLIAEVLPRIYERDPAQGRARLDELRQLTRGALAEMRTLLLELRPATLAEANLPDLLKQLGEAVTGRARIPVDVEVDEACIVLPPDARVALYRIAQEALNNVAKHSTASKARVTLSCGESEGSVKLLIVDDGSGFEPSAASGGQLGLGIMRERADSVGAMLEVRSQPGRGTEVQVDWEQ